ncbi:MULTISPECIES: hypothetical protein [unclassified Sphingomonas]|uniref:hypothetical protein n=1 Tax=unclassified Sphingomonas TaxID=196159 RepID=UPI0006F64137|nr:MULTISPECIES: hypothetical protein [unclassified Sphingomonas]KQX25948.1 hypothetical protein ASD17_00290 [Sphingomonas sp. Root1294]KQY69013.1 hypothetical protein ASD39_01485 [Sphingomonas sp. Root50]KRB89269.1 hypothetical protein ASE22_16400 [Sphingomonas sp. Root720]
MASRPIDIRQLAALLLLPLALSGCTATSSSPPVPVPPPAAPPPAAPVPHGGDWRDWPLTAGTWRYVPGTPVSTARYGDPQASQFVVQCDATKRQVTIMRAGTSTQIEIIASSRSARFPAGHILDRGAAMSAVVLSANDGFLDVMAFSRGRIAVRSPGLPDLAIPAWAEPARAIEDCRK